MEKENKKLDLCEKLAGCPKGTKLWSPLFGEVEFAGFPPDKTLILVRSDKEGMTTAFDKRGYYYDSSEECMLFPSRENRDWDSWECPKPKEERFDPKTLQPFDKVLVRDESDDDWRIDFFGFFDKKSRFCAVTTSMWHYCIPYNEDTKHLLGTADEAPEYYRWREDE